MDVLMEKFGGGEVLRKAVSGMLLSPVGFSLTYFSDDDSNQSADRKADARLASFLIGVSTSNGNQAYAYQ